MNVPVQNIPSTDYRLDRKIVVPRESKSYIEVTIHLFHKSADHFWKLEVTLLWDNLLLKNFPSKSYTHKIKIKLRQKLLH